MAGIYKLKMQNAVIELQSRVVVQSVDSNNIIVKVILNPIGIAFDYYVQYAGKLIYN